MINNLFTNCYKWHYFVLLSCISLFTDVCFEYFYCYNLSGVTSLILDSFFGPNSLLAFWLFELFLPYFIYYNHLTLKLFLPILQALPYFSWYTVSGSAAACNGVLLFFPLNWFLYTRYCWISTLCTGYCWISALYNCCLQHVDCCFLNAIASISLIE